MYMSLPPPSSFLSPSSLQKTEWMITTCNNALCAMMDIFTQYFDSVCLCGVIDSFPLQYKQLCTN